jgi:hypothetical protein
LGHNPTDSAQHAKRSKRFLKGDAMAQMEQPTIKPDYAKSYNKFKKFKGKTYTGAKVGRGQRWHYAVGEWKERKITPERWQFSYNVGKRRTGNAPEGSGAPIGTQYHWFIIADQIVKKLDANNYSTEMIGTKFKVAHKRAGKNKWSANELKQRQEMVKDLKKIIDELETASEPKTENTASSKEENKTKNS